MRIVFVAWQGSEHTRRWISFFADRGHEVHVVTCGGGTSEKQPSVYTVHDLGAPRLGKIGYFGKIPAARRVIRRLGPDVVHAHSATSYGMLALASGERPLVVTAHGSDLLISPRNWLLRKVVVQVLRAAKLITVPNEDMRATAEALASPEKRHVVVVQYGVEVKRLVELGERLRGSEEAEKLRIVSVRHLWPLYRVDLLVQALARLRDVEVDFSCDIAGDGPQRKALARLVTDLELDDRVVFHGHLSAPRTEELIAASDVYVSLAESDGVSISLLEALALGSVPVLSDIPANRGWIEDRVSGVIVEPTTESVANGIRCAAHLDRASVVRTNVATVRQRADRATNLNRLEGLLFEAVRAEQNKAA